VGFSHDQSTLRTMLASMLGADGGPPDKLLAVTHPLTGGYYVIPSADRLAAFEGETGAMLDTLSRGERAHRELEDGA
jgi:hypothetical protein